MPRASTRSSTRRVLTPATHASWTTLRRARSARRRGSSRLGKYEPSRTLGMARPIVPTRVSQRRSRYPFRFVSRRSGARSPLAAPVSSETSASMIASAEHPDPFAQDIDVSVGGRLAEHVEHGHPVLGHRDLPFVVGSQSNDARMTRWPTRRSASPAVTPSSGTRPSSVGAVADDPASSSAARGRRS
jgi:hypothetical protein